MASEIMADISTLTLEDLQEEYEKLFSSYQNLNKIHDNDLQQIYELQRNLKISKAAEVHLTQELDAVSALQNVDSEKLNKKLNQELEEYKRKIMDLEDYIDILEKKFETLTFENKKLQNQFYDISATLKKENEIKKNYALNDNQEKLESENLELLAKLNESQEIIQKSYILIAEKERKIEVLTEEIQCFQENLQAKKDELEEKATVLENLQERIADMNTELMSLRSQPTNENEKGNSLFAEVDDQRQEMKKTLIAQKKCYLQMKKIYNESQFEIRRLKRENTAMQSEIQACSSIFLNSKKFYEEKLIQRISVLSKENNELEKKLNMSQDQLISLAEKNEITWLDSLMTFCKNETKELKTQLQNIRLQKGIIEKNYRESQEELAKWRFEALKSRCLIIDRESLLDENSICYKNFNEMKIKLNEDTVSKSGPQISCSKDIKIKMDLDLDSNYNLEYDKNEIKKCTKTVENPLMKFDEVIDNFKDSNDILLGKKIETKTVAIVTKNFNFKNDVLPKIENISFENQECTSQKNTQNFGIFEDSFYTENKFNQAQKIVDEIKIKDKENENYFLQKSNKNSTFNNLKPNNKGKFEIKSSENCQNIEKDFDPAAMKVITKKTKSNIIIKKLVITSKEKKF